MHSTSLVIVQVHGPQNFKYLLLQTVLTVIGSTHAESHLGVSENMRAPSSRLEKLTSDVRRARFCPKSGVWIGWHSKESQLQY